MVTTLWRVGAIGNGQFWRVSLSPGTIYREGRLAGYAWNPTCQTGPEIVIDLSARYVAIDRSLFGTRLDYS